VLLVAVTVARHNTHFRLVSFTVWKPFAIKASDATLRGTGIALTSYRDSRVSILQEKLKIIPSYGGIILYRLPLKFTS